MNNTLQLYNPLDQSVIIYMNVYVVIKFLFRDLGSVFVGGIYFIKEVVEHPPFQPSLWMIIFHNLLSVMVIFPIISSSFPRNINIWMLFKRDNIQKATKFIQKIPQYTFSCFSYSKSYQQLLKVSAYSYFISATIISWRVKISCMSVYVIKLCNITRNNVKFTDISNCFYNTEEYSFFSTVEHQKSGINAFLEKSASQPSQDANISLNLLLKENRNISQRKNHP